MHNKHGLSSLMTLDSASTETSTMAANQRAVVLLVDDQAIIAEGIRRMLAG